MERLESGLTATQQGLWKQLEAAGLALLFAVCVVSVPWEALLGAPHEDFWVYVLTFEPSEETAREIYQPTGLLQYFTHEILWHDLVNALVAVTRDPVAALQLVSLFVLFVSAFVLYRRYGYLLPTLFLLNELFLTFALSQLRLALAVSLLLVAVESRSRLLRWGLLLAATFIHSSIPVFAGLYLVVKWVERRGERITMNQLLAVVAVVVAALAFMLAFGREALLLSAGDRRAQVYESMPAQSLVYASFWFLFVGMQIASGRDYLRRPDNLYALLLVCLFIALTLLGTFGARFIAAGFVLIIAAALNMSAQNRNVLIPAFLCYQILQYYYWFDLSR